jgi:hypothetical protein
MTASPALGEALPALEKKDLACPGGEASPRPGRAHLP